MFHMKKIVAFAHVLLAGFSACVVSPTPREHAPIDKERVSAFSDTINKKPVRLYTLKNKNGMTVEISNYGATLVAIHVPDKNGSSKNVLLGYDDINGYYSGKSYFGCVVGRYANRIAKGSFTLDGNVYQLPQNDGLNSLHGGGNSIDKQVWDARIMNDAIRFTIVMKDGENGYPGNVKLTVVYSLRADNSLVIDYSALTDKSTILNISNHAYFNLSGDPSQSILDHEIKINADAFTPVDSTLIPTGELKTVAGTPFDFLTAKKIGRDIDNQDQQLIFGKGYDHNFVLNKSGDGIPAVEVENKTTGIKMDVRTTQPGIQFYTGNFLNGTEKGRAVAYQFRTGFCLETQQFPDAPNQPNFPSAVLRPGETWKSRTSYTFSVVK
jgi:aldose 1-epimerase